MQHQGAGPGPWDQPLLQSQLLGCICSESHRSDGPQGQGDDAPGKDLWASCMGIPYRGAAVSQEPLPSPISKDATGRGCLATPTTRSARAPHVGSLPLGGAEGGWDQEAR